MRTDLIERVPGDVVANVVRSELLDEGEDGLVVADLDVVHLLGDHLRQIDVVRQSGQRDVLSEPRQSDEHVTMVVLVDEGRVDAHVLGDGLLGPAAAERAPRPVQLLDLELAEVGLEQLAQIVAELHVEVAVEDVLAATGLPLHEPLDVREHVHGRLAEDGVEVGAVRRHDLHRDAQVTVAGEDVDGPAHLQLRVVRLLDVSATAAFALDRAAQHH